MASIGFRLWSSLSGLVFVVLAIVGTALLVDGPSDESPAKMAAYYGKGSNRTHMHIGWVLAGLGLFALIWFVAALRERVRESEQASPEQGTFLSTVVLVGGTVYVAVTMVAIAVADGIRTMSDDTYKHQVYSGVIHAAGDASYMLIVTAGAAMAAMIFATALAVRRYAILPRWVSWFGFVAGVAAIFSLAFFTMLVWLLWIAVASVLLFTGSRSAAPARREPASPAAA
jgi:hypothetical protein